MKTKAGIEINEQIGWKAISPGGIVTEAGSAQHFKTGDWRTMRPVWLQEKCRQCLLCAPTCPDSSIPVVERKREKFDYDHCKGCGICVKACPFEAIEWTKEIK
ncbi:4Fe-4S binding protein [Anoxynatronum buryatiense]|uniref:Pyruvate ferredoxin oxidoreductase delta subunit n=1 Tax=Anoxynatronum buryatiense TaxID=489973 RepID=A0AA46AHN2_9CLOT|nr:4Fe-4S binding protein [Anoxynatronum buryatiense]SMP41069.1 pyruvate ferredoxin oxidoreductase delta subunit [Anoxynatronum buryatiense]